MYGSRRQSHHGRLLSFGVILTALLRVNAQDVAMTFLRDLYVNAAHHGHLIALTSRRPIQYTRTMFQDVKNAFSSSVTSL